MANEIEAPANEVLANFKEIVVHALHRGLTIHPLKPRDKNPWLKGWPDQASKDLKVVLEWAARFPTSNYGVAANDEFCILESDDFSHLLELLGGVKIPMTYTVAARPNRPHFYFKQTEASRAAGNLDLPGTFEFKQRNKYVVGEGSIHPKGPVYLCRRGGEIVPIPDDLVAKLVELKSGTRARVSAPGPAMGMKLPEGGGRQGFLMRTCAQMWDGKKTQEEMFEELQTINLDNCDPPKETHKVVSMIEWIMDREPVKTNAKPVFRKPTLGTAVKSGGAFQYALGPFEKDKYGAFGTRRVHAIYGASGAGKTTLAFQMLESIKHGRPFLDRQTYGWDYIVLWQDRGAADLEEQLDNLGLEGQPDNYYVITDEERELGPSQAINLKYLEHKERTGDSVRVVFAEGLDLWVQDTCDAKEVTTEVNRVRTVAEQYDIAVIGTLGSPKHKAKDGYVAARDRIIGSSVWGRVLSTVLEVKEREDDHDRIVTLLPRSTKQQAVRMKMGDDGLEVIRPAVPMMSSQRLPKDIALDLARLGVPDRTIRDWIAKGVDLAQKLKEKQSQ